LSKKNKARSIKQSDFKIYYKAILTKEHDVSIKNRLDLSSNKTE
jgi:hypothetical protein